MEQQQRKYETLNFKNVQKWPHRASSAKRASLFELFHILAFVSALFSSVAVCHRQKSIENLLL